MNCVISERRLEDYDFYLSRSAVPPGWVITSLQDVSSVITDGTHKTPNYVPCGVRFISIKNIKPFRPINWDRYEKYITSEEHAELTRRCKPERDDILFPRIGTLGYAKRIDFDEEVSLFVGLGLVKPIKDCVLPKFVEYYLNTPYIAKLSENKANGTGRMTLPLEESRRFPFPLPPLAEQYRIVGKIEELFSELDKGVESLTTAREQLKAYRQSVLKSAFSDGLVGSNPSDWTEYTVGQLATDIRYGTAKKCEVDPTKTPVLRIPNVASGRIDLAHLKHTDFTADELDKLRLEPGDILIVRSNGSASLVGLSAIVTDEAAGYAYAGYLIRLRIKKDVVLPAFLNLYLHSPMVRAGIEHQARSSSGVHNVNSDEIRAIALRIPPIPTQLMIVDAVSEIQSQIETLAFSIGTELMRSNALRYAILQKAFSGQLVAQDARDEAASVLLKRICAGQHEGGAKKRRNSKNGRKEPA